MEQSWLLAVGLVLLIEGAMLLISPKQWRATMLLVTQLQDGQIRFLGLGAVLLGLVLVLI